MVRRCSNDFSLSQNPLAHHLETTDVVTVTKLKVTAAVSHVACMHVGRLWIVSATVRCCSYVLNRCRHKNPFASDNVKTWIWLIIGKSLL